MLKHLACYGIAGLLLFAGSSLSFAESAADTYKAKCQMCHAPDGSGDTPAGKATKVHPFKSPDVLKQSDADLIAIVKNGKEKMPAFAGKITDAQITDLVEYIHTLQKK
ncbi:c-type cytochrome [Edaphobacter bradus]|uniref:c-type cytochrome n=1 Tax=Edaphobacter bradus TaxID=2259016 RepID=UPI0021DFF18A|nr:cytochrome c [Edaphobacter bradus]